MRSIIHELEYETPLAAGRLRYVLDGEPTGVTEAWRLTAAVDEYRFLRVDLDARDAASGRSYLFHMVLNPEGRPEQLKYRVFGAGLLVSGAIVWEAATLSGSRTVNEQSFEDVVARGVFWFPSVLGLSTLISQLDPAEGTTEQPGATLLTDSDGVDETFKLVATPVRVRYAPVDNDLPQKAHSHLRVAWSGNRRDLWLDEAGFPIRLQRPDGLEALATQLVVYQS